MTLTAIQLENCADWNMREAELSAHKALNEQVEDVRAYHARRAARLDAQAFLLFRQAHEARSAPRAA